MYGQQSEEILKLHMPDTSACLRKFASQSCPYYWVCVWSSSLSWMTGRSMSAFIWIMFESFSFQSMHCVIFTEMVNGCCANWSWYLGFNLLMFLLALLQTTNCVTIPQCYTSNLSFSFTGEEALCVPNYRDLWFRCHQLHGSTVSPDRLLCSGDEGGG